MDTLYTIITLIGGTLYNFMGAFFIQHNLLTDIKEVEKPIVINNKILNDYQTKVSYYNSFKKLNELEIETGYDNKKYIIQTLRINQ